jgi:hypothetical protein
VTVTPRKNCSKACPARRRRRWHERLRVAWHPLSLWAPQYDSLKLQAASHKIFQPMVRCWRAGEERRDPAGRGGAKSGAGKGSGKNLGHELRWRRQDWPGGAKKLKSCVGMNCLNRVAHGSADEVQYSMHKCAASGAAAVTTTTTLSTLQQAAGRPEGHQQAPPAQYQHAERGMRHRWAVGVLQDGWRAPEQPQAAFYPKLKPPGDSA